MQEQPPTAQLPPSAEQKTVMAMAEKKPAMQEDEAALSTDVTATAPNVRSGPGTRNPLAAHVTATALNVRSGPGTRNPLVGILLKYDPVTITAERGIWYNIDAAGGYVDGWVSGAYLSLSPPPGEAGGEVVDYGAQETPTLEKGKFKYVGVTACKKCHVKSTGQFPKGAFSVWKGHLHSQAFRYLSQNDSRETARVLGIDDPVKDWRCVKCHSTAYGADASQLTETYSDADGVGCEVCHGPGSAYAEIDHGPSNADRHSLGFYKLENLGDREAVCVSCHNPTSPTYKPFNILAFSREIRHWSDPDDTAYFTYATKVGHERERKVAALTTQPAEDSPPVVQTDSADQVTEAPAPEKQMQQETDGQIKADQEKRRQEVVQAKQVKQEAEAQAKAAQMQREAEEKAKAEEAERKAQAELKRQKTQEQAEVERQQKAATAAETASAAATGVERHLAGLAATFTRNANGKKYQTVLFTHSAHADKNYVASIQCQTCHHTQEGDDKPEPCSNCHNIDGDAEEEKLKTKATHSKAHPFPKDSADQEQVSCIGCHKAQNSLLEAGQRAGKQAPTKCTGCHKKKST